MDEKNSGEQLDDLLKEFETLSNNGNKPSEVENPQNSAPSPAASGPVISPQPAMPTGPVPAPGINGNSAQGTNSASVSSNQQSGVVPGNNIPPAQGITTQNPNQSVTNMTGQPMTNPTLSTGNPTPNGQGSVNIPEQLNSSNPNMSEDNNITINPNLNTNLDRNATGFSDLPKTPSNDTPPNIEKNGKSSNLFIIVLFLIVALFIFFLPKINDFVHKKPAKAKPTPTPTVTATPSANAEKTKKLTCTMPASKDDKTSKETMVVYHYTYENNKLKKIEVVTKDQYTVANDTNKTVIGADTTTCNDINALKDKVDGYKITCDVANNTFTKTENYDLSSFVSPSEITIGKTKKTLTTNFNLDDNIDTIKDTMTSQGATCK